MTQRFTNLKAAGSQWLAALGVLCRLVARSFVFLLVVVALLGSRALVSGQDAVALDYQVKAAFLVNFPKYVDWPTTAFSGTNTSITVAVFGDDNVANEFQNMIQSGLVIDGHPVILKRIKSDVEITGSCQILFVANSERSRVSAILEKLKGSPVLLVGDSDNFLEQGGMINMVPKNRKVRLQINLGAAREASLKISSRLLVAADVVKGKEN